MSIYTTPHFTIGIIIVADFLISGVLFFASYFFLKHEHIYSDYDKDIIRNIPRVNNTSYNIEIKDEELEEELKEEICEQKEEKPKPEPEKPKYKSYLTWICAYCGQTNKNTELSCPHCAAVRKDNTFEEYNPEDKIKYFWA